MSLGKIFTAAFVFFLTCAAMVTFRHEIGDVLNPSRKSIVAQVKLDNRCELRDYVFILRDVDTGKYASFSGGRARLRTVERNRVQVEYAPIYKDVAYQGYAFPAKSQMTMVADCRSKSIFNLDWLKSD